MQQMKYFILETTMVRDAYKSPNFRKALAGHMQFVKDQFEQGLILFSGNKPDQSGGVRVLKLREDQAVETYWQPDPMAAAGLLEYRVTAFAPLDLTKGLESWFTN